MYSHAESVEKIVDLQEKFSTLKKNLAAHKETLGADSQYQLMARQINRQHSACDSKVDEVLSNESATLSKQSISEFAAFYNDYESQVSQLVAQQSTKNLDKNREIYRGSSPTEMKMRKDFSASCVVVRESLGKLGNETPAECEKLREEFNNLTRPDSEFAKLLTLAEKKVQLTALSKKVEDALSVAAIKKMEHRGANK